MVEYDIHLDDKVGQLREFDVLDAKLEIEIEGRGAAVLMVEPAGVVPTGD